MTGLFLDYGSGGQDLFLPMQIFYLLSDFCSFNLIKKCFQTIDLTISALVIIPARSPLRFRTGTLFTLFLIIIFAISLTGVFSLTVLTLAVMTSSTFVPRYFLRLLLNLFRLSRYIMLSSNLKYLGKCRSESLMIRSPSVALPTILPSSSTTGTPLILFFKSNSESFSIEAYFLIVMTFFIMIFFAKSFAISISYHLYFLIKYFCI